MLPKRLQVLLEVNSMRPCFALCLVSYIKCHA